ncbi:hypothetical protein D8B25_16030 [Verminephrobacter aporrectodeae subsp. tuberculatae]|nr:hypothetical protein [Verminephrobacter aporrectodeae subsp. tuberculatae]MCW8204361.1 hypothetical protein [Verminephrobacter aporrectodeae subsp. tuberculatae]
MQQTAGSGGLKCPSRDFSKFIQAFSENKDVQIKFTKYPLKEQVLDLNAEPEPKPVMRTLRRDQISFPVMPGEADRKKWNLIFRIDEIKSNRAKVNVMSDDSDSFVVDYFFVLDSCWYLKRMEDSSFVIRDDL